jgi:hypothetical protein
LEESVIKWVVSPHSKLFLNDLLLSLQNLLVSRAILSLGMLSYFSSEATVKEDNTNSKSDETVVVALASWPPTQVLVIKALLVKEAS